MTQDWKFFGEWNNIPMFYCLFWYNIEVNIRLQKLFNTSRNAAFLIKDRKQHLFFHKKWLADLKEQIYSTEPEKIISQLQAFYPTFEDVMEKLLSYYDAEYHDCSDAKLEKEFRYILDMMMKVTPFDQYCMISEQFQLKRLEEYLDKALPEAEKKERYNLILTTLTAPTRITLTQNEELSLMSMALEVQQGKEISEEQINKYIKEYGWLPVFLFGEAWSSSYISSEIETLSKDDLLNSKINRLKIFPEKQKKKISEIERKFNLDKGFAKVMQELAFIRNEAEVVISLGTQILRPIYKEIFERTSLTEKELACLTPKEVSEVLLNNKDCSQIIPPRLEPTFYISTPENIEVITGTEAARLFEDNYVKPAQEHADRIKGMGACPGIAEGTIRIINDVNDMQEFKEGDILVSEATCIDFLPVMRKAAAILTCMGGITSHAAIVSRELGVPCIIGIPNLLGLLYSGQKVRVNADKGTVETIDS